LLDIAVQSSNRFTVRRLVTFQESTNVPSKPHPAKFHG
jgi:hypothetical protein